MFRFFTNRKDRKEYNSAMQKIKEKSPRLFEIVSAASIATIEVMRVAQMLDEGGQIHGWYTVTHGVWHDDPNGPLEINGKRGFYTYEQLCKNKDNLLTNGGRDFFHNQVYTNTSAGTRGGNYIAVSANAGGAAAGHTSLAGEIASGGLARADADTKSHTNGTNTSTIEHTYTASAIHTDVQLCALFNASSVGTMTHEATFTAVTLQINDTLKVTWTLTLG